MKNIKNQSQELFAKAKHYMPGGVNSPVRAFKAVGGDPVFFSSAKGAYLFDTNRRKYIDYIGAWGPMILGHAYPAVTKAIQAAVENGLCFGAPNVLETELAKRICELMPSIEKVRFVNSGTEATMTAVRLARGITGRNKIIKFDGCYHGHSDSLLVNAGSGMLTLGIPASPGVPPSIAAETLVADFNNLDQVENFFKNYSHDIAAIILEPIPGNMNLVTPKLSFLQGLREICNHYGALLIFDEVMTGFRVALGGATAIFNVIPDLITLGKIIGGGIPIGAIGGKKTFMDYLAPEGPVYQAGTFSGNPIAMTAGINTLDEINTTDFFPRLSQQTENLIHGLNFLAKKYDAHFHSLCIGGMFGLYFFEEKEILSYKDIKESTSTTTFNSFFHAMLERHIYFAPSAFEAGFVSAAHTSEDIETTLRAAEEVFSLRKN